MKVFIIIFIILIVLLMPIKIQIIKNMNNDKYVNDINIYFIKIFNIRIDFDRFLYKTLKIKKSNNLNNIITNINYIKNNKSLLTNFLSLITLNKITLIYKTNNLLLSFLSWNSIYIIRNLYSNLLDIENEYYNVIYDEDIENRIVYDIQFKIRIIYFLLAYVLNIYEKFKKRRHKNVRTSN